jgi:hypothetical protein
MLAVLRVFTARDWLSASQHRSRHCSMQENSELKHQLGQKIKETSARNSLVKITEVWRTKKLIKIEISQRRINFIVYN